MAQLRYPYTLGAMVMRYPLKTHVQRNWVYKAYGIGLLLCLPIFAKITASIPEPKQKADAHH
uniref:Isoform A n=1 Tax=Pseudodiaptomus poplesia TaxID=213370 RepID=A0A0U2VCZ9_9MAXI|nr:isoform A [Pseudodiaptomus poplesia]